MKKYFKIDLQIRDCSLDKNNNIQKGYAYYHGDGAIRIENDYFEGYCGLDYIQGDFQNNILHLKITDYDLEGKEIELEAKFNETFELPKNFGLLLSPTKLIIFNVYSVISNKSFQKSIDESIEQAKACNTIRF